MMMIVIELSRQIKHKRPRFYINNLSISYGQNTGKSDSCTLIELELELSKNVYD